MLDIILICGILLIPLIAQIKVKSSYKKYRKTENGSGLTGFDVARKILDNNELNNIYIVEVQGELTDHYDPRQRVVRLSSEIYHGKSIAALAVAAHECGHAIQHKEKYSFLQFRTTIYPLVNVATSISYYIILLGFLMELIDLVWLGILLTSLGLVFQVVTLPVEFNASSRAKQLVFDYGLCTTEERNGVSSMLIAAAMTYVAGVLASAMQILRLVLAARRRD